MDDKRTKMKVKIMVLGVLMILGASVGVAYMHVQFSKASVQGDDGNKSKIVLTRYQNALSIAVIANSSTDQIWCRVTRLSRPRWFSVNDSSYSIRLKRMDATRFWGQSVLTKNDKKVKVTCMLRGKAVTVYSIFNPNPQSFGNLSKYVYTTWPGHFAKVA